VIAALPTPEHSSGYIMISATGGLNQQRVAVTYPILSQIFPSDVLQQIYTFDTLCVGPHSPWKLSSIFRQGRGRIGHLKRMCSFRQCSGTLGIAGLQCCGGGTYAECCPSFT